MKIIQSYTEILTPIEGDEIIKFIELVGRTCYKSENNITLDSSKTFIKNIIKRGHESVIEHFSISVRFVCDRGISHEIVRHRLASYSQESTRYCNYSKDNLGGELTFILPLWFKNDYKCLKNPENFILNNNISKEEIQRLTILLAKFNQWESLCKKSEETYFTLLSLGSSPQEARSVLPNSLKTDLVMTANLREWRHFFKLRSSEAAHPQMRELVQPLLYEFQEKIPIIFD